MSIKTTDTLALFDFDGTLCQIDSFTGFYHALHGKIGFSKKCVPILPSIVRYYAGHLPADQMRPILSNHLLKNLNQFDVTALAENFAYYLIHKKLNISVLDKLKWHQAQGHHVCIVSAGLNIYLSYVAQNFDVDLICSEAEIIQDTFTGRYKNKDCSCEEKVRRINQHYDLTQFSKIYAYGNSHEDFAMLRLADHVTWVDQAHQLHRFK